MRRVPDSTRVYEKAGFYFEAEFPAHGKYDTSDELHDCQLYVLTVEE